MKIAYSLTAILLLISQPAMARSGGFAATELFKLAPPGALAVIGCLIVTIVGLIVGALRTKSEQLRNSLITLALLLVLPLLGLVVWYQPILLVAGMAGVSLYVKFGSGPLMTALRDKARQTRESKFY